MAILVPSIEEIESLPTKLTNGERRLMNALLEALDDEWSVYVQPHLNGLKPDIVIFSENAGVGIFEVKDWNLDCYRIHDKQWQVYQSSWHYTEEKCPLKQVEKYKESIIKYEIPVLGTELAVNKEIYPLIQTFVYFDLNTTAEIQEKLKEILDKYSNVFGYDKLNPHSLRNLLARRRLTHGSKFTEWMQSNDLGNRLRNALAYPKHRATDLGNLLAKPESKQRDLLPNKIGSRRVLGAAGSGKTFVLVHKAVNAARDGKRVLVVCFNITMVNYLRDLINRLARYYAPHCHRMIQISHFHRLFPPIDETLDMETEIIKDPIDVLLIDEGQDFERSWIEKCQSLCAANYHLMFFEDGRQNIYGKSIRARESVPGIRGTQNKLNKSKRLPKQTAELANAFSRWSKQESQSEDVTSTKAVQGDVFVKNVWFDGTKSTAIKAIQDDLQALTLDPNTARADIAVLVCSVEDGWDICKILDNLHLPCQRNFESQDEYRQLYQQYREDINKFKQELDKLRRCYKAGFWMQGGRIKVCTIHSFKGWELSNILVFFNTNDSQIEKAALLYTGITRSQQCLTVYNTDLDFYDFGNLAISQGYANSHPQRESTQLQTRKNSSSEVVRIPEYDEIPF